MKVLDSFGIDERYIPITFDSFIDRLSFLFTITGRYILLIVFPVKMSAQYNWIIPIWEEGKWTSIFVILGILTILGALGGLLYCLFKGKHLQAYFIFGSLVLMLLSSADIIIY